MRASTKQMEQRGNVKAKLSRPFGYLIFGIPWLMSLPFWAGAAVAARDAMYLPDTRGSLAKAQLWQAAVFSFGLALGLTAVAAALGSSNRRRRKCGVAGVVFAISCVVLALVMGWSIEQSNTDPYLILPFLVPSILAFSSLMLLLDSVRIQDDPSETSAHEITEEQPQPLSRP